MLRKLMNLSDNLSKRAGKVTLKIQNEKQCVYNKWEKKASEPLLELKNSKTIGNINAVNQLLTMGSIYATTAKLAYIGGHFNCPVGEGKFKRVMVIDGEGIIVEGIPQLITLDEIQTIEFKSQQDLEKNVTLTRLMAFGIYALALKKKKMIVQNFFIINCKLGEVKYSLVFEGANAGEIYNKLFQELIKKKEN